MKFIKNVVLTTILLLPFQSFSADDADEYFHGEPVYMLESAYESAPRRVHRIVDTLLDKNRGPGRYQLNYALFDGESGVAKSTLALAVAYKSHWDPQRLGPDDFMKVENRNGTSVVFNNIMSQFQDCRDNTVIIIDEINYLLMNYDSKHHDTDTSAMSLWRFLDKIKTKSNLFLIGTTNGIGGFPPQMRTRLESAIVTVTSEKDPIRIKNDLLKGLSYKQVIIPDETRKHIDTCIPLLQGRNIRNIERLIYEILGQAYEQPEAKLDDETLVIKPEHIDAAFRAFEDIEVRFNAKPYNETEAEQRERHHKEVLAQNNRQFLISTFTSGALNVVNLAASLYFNRSLHISAMDAQRTLHGELLQAQTSMHRDALNRQKSLHNEALKHQQDLHNRTSANN